MTHLSRSADDRFQMSRPAWRPRSLQDLALTAAFFVAVAVTIGFVFGIFGN